MAIRQFGHGKFRQPGKDKLCAHFPHRERARSEASKSRRSTAGSGAL